MKNLSIVLNGVLLVAVIVLFVLHFSGRKGCEQGEVAPILAENGGATKIVYINTDSLMSSYKLALELNEVFLKKQEEEQN